MFDASDWRARSPFYGEEHRAVSDSVRRFVEQEVEPHVADWEAEGMIPKSAMKKAGEAGILALGCPEDYGGVSEGIDLFHRFCQIEELCSPGYGALPFGILSHMATLPVVLAGGSEALKAEVVPPVLTGDLQLAVAISEYGAGSDVAQLTTRAERRGDRFIVNGAKAYVTHGMRADKVAVTVRTGGAGIPGLSILLVDADAKGVSRVRTHKMGGHCDDLAEMHFDDVEVPDDRLLSPENGGFLKAMEGLNNERIQMAQLCCGLARVCINEAAGWARQRKTFGKTLVEHQAIRMKLGGMQTLVQAAQAQVDLAAWQVRENRIRPADFAVTKVVATRALESIVRDAVQILGGLGCVKGTKSERIYHETQIFSIAGGADSIMIDLIGKQSFARA